MRQGTLNMRTEIRGLGPVGEHIVITPGAIGFCAVLGHLIIEGICASSDGFAYLEIEFSAADGQWWRHRVPLSPRDLWFAGPAPSQHRPAPFAPDFTLNAV